MHVLMEPFCMRQSLDCINGLTACLKAASLIQWACFGAKMDSVIQTATALCQLSFVEVLYIVWAAQDKCMRVML